MTRARDYVSLDVTERLFRSHPNSNTNNNHQLSAAAAASRAGFSAGYSDVEGPLPPDNYYYDGSTQEEGEGGEGRNAVANPRSEGRRRSWDQPPGYRSEGSR